MSVSCRQCGQAWPRDPVLEVACPDCGAKVGQRCRRPSGHNVWGAAHADRRRRAAEEIPGYAVCAAGHQAPAPEQLQMDLEAR